MSKPVPYNNVLYDEEYILLPCSGRYNVNIPRGHLFKVENRDGNFLGFITKEVAEKKYPKNFFISRSDSICPICSLVLEGEITINLILKNA